MTVTSDGADRMVLSRITGEFIDPATEREFRSDQIAEAVSQARFLFALITVASAMFLAVNLLLLDPALARQAILSRAAAFAASLAAFLVIGVVPSRWFDPITLGWQFVITLSAASLLSLQQQIASAVVLLLPSLFYLVVPATFRATIFIGVTSSAIMLAAYSQIDGVVADLFRITVALVLVNGLLGFFKSRSCHMLRMQWASGRATSKALAELAESRALLERTLMAVPVPLVMTSSTTNIITRANDAAEQFLQVPEGSLVGRSVLTCYTDPGDRLLLTTALRAEGHARDFRTRLRRSDGSSRSVLLSARSIDPSDGDGTDIVVGIMDVTDQEAREGALRAAEAEYRTLFENATVGIFRSTLDGRLLRANPTLVRMNGYATEAELVDAINDIGAEWYAEPERRSEWLALMREHGRVTDFVSEVYRHKTRERIWVSESAWIIEAENGEPIWFEGMIVEATERKEAEAKIEHLAQFDLLTDLPNRRLFMTRLEHEAVRTTRHGGYFGIMYLDLDGFKTVNDAFGHAAGDLLLQQVADRLRTVCRAEDTIARIGGDEFIVLSVGLPNPESLAGLAERIVGAFRRPFILDGTRASIGTSIGIAVAPNDGLDPEALLKKADSALYRAKAEGRGVFRFFNPSLDRLVPASEVPLRSAARG